MPLSYAKIQKNEATTTIAAYGETLTIVYYPSKVTDEIFVKFAGFDGITSVSMARDALLGLNEMLSGLIKSWDFFEDDEQKVMWPLTHDRLAQLELSFKMKCMYAIMSDVRPEAVVPQTQN
jgi:hypothetical protein